MTQLIARETYFKQLDNILQEALRGNMHTIFVTGEAGIGKTALVAVFAERAKRAVPDLFVAGSKCYGQQEPYLPFWQIIDAFTTEECGGSVWDRLRRGMAELAPEWIQVLPGGGIAAATIRTVQWGQSEFSDKGQGADTSRRLVQYTNALKLAAETTPLLLWIDDLHWADNATLDLIAFLADHARDARLLLSGWN